MQWRATIRKLALCEHWWIRRRISILRLYYSMSAFTEFFCPPRIYCETCLLNLHWRRLKSAPEVCPFGVTLATAQAEREKAIAKQQAQSAPRPPCIHLGKLTGEALLCSTCGGAKMELVHLCAVHGTCTITRAAKGVACCDGCREYQPHENACAEPSEAYSATQAGVSPLAASTDLNA